MITKVVKLSDLSILSKVLDYGKTIVASGRQNYAINVSQLKGDRIIHMSEVEASPADGERMNTIILDFDNNTRKYFNVWNGTDGDKGNPGIEGPEGDKGDSFSMNEVLNRADGVLTIANDDVTNDPTKVWSAYRGKVMEDFLKSIAEIIITDEEYQLLFNDQIFIDLEFTTKTDNKNVALLHNDNASHKTYVKYWTYEDEGAERYYYLDPVTNEYVEVPNTFDVWNDLYLSDTTTEYYTRELHTWVVDEMTGATNSEWVYTKVSVPVWLELEFETKEEDQRSRLITSDKELGDDGDVSHDPTEEEIIITHRPIISISVDEPNFTMPINSIITKAINIRPVDYLNSPIQIEYDENKIKVFEDGRIMALENNCETSVKISSVDDPRIFATININIVTYVDYISFDTNSIKAFKGISQQINATVYPETASNKTIEWSSSDDEIAKVDQNGLITLISEGNVTIYAAATDGSGVISRIDVMVDTAVSNINVEDTYEILVGIPTVIHASVEPETASNDKLDWSSLSSNISVSTASNNVDGQIYVGSKQDGRIMVTANDGSGVYKEINIVAKNPVLEINLDKNDLTLDLNDSYQLIATVNDNADNKDLEWISSNPNVATVDENGLVQAVGGGIATIRAIAADGSGTVSECVVNSVILITAINLENNNIEIYANNTYRINYTIEPSSITAPRIIWYSSDENVAVVNGNIITGINEGTCNIYAMADDNSGVISSADVKVSIPTRELILSDYELNLKVDDNYSLIATVIPDNTTNQNVEFTISDDSIAMIDNNGNITALKEGTTTIFVKTIDGSNLSVECTLNII